MKALIVSQPASDGVFRHVEGLVDFLMGEGVAVDLAYSDRQACDQLLPLVERVRAAGGRTLNLQVGNAPSAADVSAVRELDRLIHEARPDVVHAHSSKAGGLVRLLAMAGRVPARVFYTPHAYYQMHSPDGLKPRFFHFIERVLGRFGETIGLSADESDFARERIRIPTRLCRQIGNGVDCTRFHPPSTTERREVRERFGIPQEALVLGTVGRFSLQKDPVTTYRALALALRTAPELFFVHLGRGELEPEVEKLLADPALRARCLRIPYLADTAPLYQALDGFVLASLYEGMSFALLEALATGLPLVLSQAPGNRGFSALPLNQVFWCEPGDAEGLAAALLAWRAAHLAGTPCNHREVALREFALEVACGRVLEVYRKSLPKPPS